MVHNRGSSTQQNFLWHYSPHSRKSACPRPALMVKCLKLFFVPPSELDIMITLDGGRGGRVRGWGGDETLITSSFLITHSYRSLQTKPLLLKNTSVTSCKRNCFVSDDFNEDTSLNSAYLHILSAYVLLLF